MTRTQAQYLACAAYFDDTGGEPRRIIADAKPDGEHWRVTVTEADGTNPKRYGIEDHSKNQAVKYDMRAQTAKEAKP